MDHAQIVNQICDVLREEQHNRVIAGGECSFLQCIGILIQANVSLIKDYIYNVLDSYPSRFKQTLSLMHHKTPFQEKEEKDALFKKRLDTYFEKVVSASKTAHASRYVDIYLYAVATVLRIPIYVLKEDERRRLSWFYFPVLFEVTSEEQLPSMSGRSYLTLFMHRSMNACMPITSNDKSVIPPPAHGYTGMQYQTLNVETDSIEVPAEILDQHTDLEMRLAELTDMELLQTYSAMMSQKGISDLDIKPESSALGLDIKVKQQFVEELVRSRTAFEIFCKIVIRNKRWDIWGLIFKDFCEDLAVKQDSHELENSYKTLSSAAEGLIKHIDQDELRSWIGILKEKTQETIQIIENENSERQFVNGLVQSKTLYRHFCEILLVRRKYDLLDCLGFSKQFQYAGSCLYLCKYKALKELEESLLERMRLVDELKQAFQQDSCDIEERRGKVNTAVIGGAATGVIGGTMAIVGLALAPVTFGVSLGLTIAGATIGGVAGVVSGGARGFEAYKQIDLLKHTKEKQIRISELETYIHELLIVIESLFSLSRSTAAVNADEDASADLRGFLAIGSALRSAHGFFAVGMAAARVGASAATIAAAVVGPLSLVLDIGFLIEASINKKRGNKVSTAEQLRETSVVIEMKSRVINSVWRGNVDEKTKIVV